MDAGGAGRGAAQRVGHHEERHEQHGPVAGDTEKNEPRRDKRKSTSQQRARTEPGGERADQPALHADERGAGDLKAAARIDGGDQLASCVSIDL